jgi:hypothetical protein
VVLVGGVQDLAKQLDRIAAGLRQALISGVGAIAGVGQVGVFRLAEVGGDLVGSLLANDSVPLDDGRITGLIAEEKLPSF